MIKTGITGADSKVAGEILRILINHPDVDLRWLQSDLHHGADASNIHQGIIGECDLKISATPDWEDVDVVFCCRHSGYSRSFIEGATIPSSVKIIDLSGDYRSLAQENGDENNEWVYGLPELNRKRLVRGARLVANPGAFASAVELALLPLAKNLLLNSPIHVSAVSGDPSLADNIRLYKPLHHEHVAEIKKSLSKLQNSFDAPIYMVPMLGSFSRGLIAAAYLDCPLPLGEIRRIYDEYYDDHNFTFVADKQVELKDVVNTNKCILHLEKDSGRLLITSVIDSWLKGSAGTAVHNMNLMFGLQERTGLALKPSAI